MLGYHQYCGGKSLDGVQYYVMEDTISTVEGNR